MEGDEDELVSIEVTERSGGSSGFGTVDTPEARKIQQDMSAGGANRRWDGDELLLLGDHLTAREEHQEREEPYVKTLYHEKL
jgi:hypothetical protein